MSLRRQRLTRRASELHQKDCFASENVDVYSQKVCYIIWIVKTGIEYARSDEKRAFDLIMAAALTPAAFASRLVLGYEIRKHIGDNESPIFLQQRRGADGEPFTIRKLLTLDKDSDVPYNRFVHGCGLAREERYHKSFRYSQSPAPRFNCAVGRCQMQIRH